MSIISTSSGRQNNNAIIIARKCALCGVSVHTDGANNCTVTIFDSATAANNGKQIGGWTVPGASQYGGRNVTPPTRANNGLYCEITGGGWYYVEYSERDIGG